MSLRDLRGMEPPEPLEIILDLAETLAQGERVSFILPHYPAPLIPHLQAMGLYYQSEIQQDDAGGIILHLERR